MGDDWWAEVVPDAVVVTVGSVGIGVGWCVEELKPNLCISDTGGGGGGGRLSLLKKSVNFYFWSINAVSSSAQRTIEQTVSQKPGMMIHRGLNTKSIWRWCSCSTKITVRKFFIQWLCVQCMCNWTHLNFVEGTTYAANSSIIAPGNRKDTFPSSCH